MNETPTDISSLLKTLLLGAVPLYGVLFVHILCSSMYLLDNVVRVT